MSHSGKIHKGEPEKLKDYTLSKQYKRIINIESNQHQKQDLARRFIVTITLPYCINATQQSTEQQ